MQAFGWTWEYVDTYMTVPRLNKIVAFWTDKQPSIAASMAAYIGFKPKKKAEVFTGGAKNNDVEQLLGMIPQRK